MSNQSAFSDRPTKQQLIQELETTNSDWALTQQQSPFWFSGASTHTKAKCELTHNILIDSEFQSLIPPLQSAELSQLEASIREFGCLDPLIVWRGMNILLDGHNRYHLSQNFKIPYLIIEIDLPSRDAALAWIANHQLGRRNVTPEIASYLRGKCYLYSKGRREDNLKQNQINCNELFEVPNNDSLLSNDCISDEGVDEPNCKNCISDEGVDEPNCKNCISDESVDEPNCKSCISDESADEPNCNNYRKVNTAKILAQQYKVGERTIHNDGVFADAIDTIEQALGIAVKHQILSRNTKLTKKDVLSLAKTARNSGASVARTILENKLNKTDIVEQIKNKQRVPNPHYKDQICQIVARGNKELKKLANCWCIIIQVNEHTCNIQTWKEVFQQ